MPEPSEQIIEHELLAVLPDIIQAGFDGNIKRLETLTITAIRRLRKSAPDTAASLSTILTSNPTSAPIRGVHFEPSPVDQDSSAPLLKVTTPERAPKPIFSAALEMQLGRFLKEWRQSKKLVSEGFLPPCSILLKGPPGTGKTMFAKWVAGELGLKFATLDLATSISSYLGKTGLNLRRALDYARATPCLLLLDEFDAVAKRRDDATEVGELKRIVNVLLKELEDWPTASLLVAATNHPELLDPAISRRFDRVFNTDIPEVPERIKILRSSLGRFDSDIKQGVLEAIVELLQGKSGSDLQALGNAAVRRHIVESEPLDFALIAEIQPLLSQGKANQKALGGMVRALRRGKGKNLTIREIASLTGLVPSTVHYHLTKP